MSQLFAACGVAFDINVKALDSLAMSGGAENSDMVVNPAGDAADGDNPLTNLVDHVCDFCDNGAAGLATYMPAQFYEHKRICAEMLLSLLEAWSTLDQIKTEDNEGFATAVADGLEKLKLKLAAMQLAYPNTFKAVHTQIAFKHVCSDYKHRLHSYVEQGFFTDEYASAVESIIKDRARGLDQYLHIDNLLSWAGLLTCNFLNKDHPVVSCASKDKGAPVAKHLAMEVGGATDKDPELESTEDASE